MRRSLIAFALTLAVAGLPAVSAHAYTVHRESGTFMFGISSLLACRDLDRCEDLDGLAIKDMEVGPAIATVDPLMTASEEGDYQLKASIRDTSLVGDGKSWALCAYAEDGTVLTCKETFSWQTRSQELTATIPKDAHWLRIILKEGASVDWQFNMWTSYVHN